MKEEREGIITKLEGIVRLVSAVNTPVILQVCIDKNEIEFVSLRRIDRPNDCSNPINDELMSDDDLEQSKAIKDNAKRFVELRQGKQEHHNFLG